MQGNRKKGIGEMTFTFFMLFFALMCCAYGFLFGLIYAIAKEVEAIHESLLRKVDAIEERILGK